MVHRIATSANAERVIKPRTFISPSQACDAEFASPDRAYGCRERLSNGRASDAAWFPARKGDSRSTRTEFMRRAPSTGCFRVRNVLRHANPNSLRYLLKSLRSPSSLGEGLPVNIHKALKAPPLSHQPASFLQ